MATAAPDTCATLLERAVNEPGIISSAYRAFYNYSFGNQLLALSQCVRRGIQPGPLGTFPHWRLLGRSVRKGEKAIVLCRPITVKKRTATADDEDDDGAVITRFTYAPRWFVLRQTEGQPLTEPPTPTWNKDRAFAALNLQEVPFTELNGNCLGVARGRTIALNPVNPVPWKTRFHESAHVLLGHTAEGVELHDDDELTSRHLREVEAEAVALLCCAALGLPGVELSRGYIQSWWGQGNAIPERSAQKILKVADQILKAGREPEVAAD